MSTNFSIAITAPDAVLSYLLYRIGYNLFLLEFDHEHSVRSLGSSIDSLQPKESTKIDYNSFTEGFFPAWSDVVAGFSAPGYEFHLQVTIIRRRNFLNVYLLLSEADIEKLYNAGRLGQLYEAVSKIAAACNAYGGVGLMGGGWLEVTPSGVVKAFLDHPEWSGHGSDVGLIKKSSMQKSELEKLLPGQYRIESVDEYWFMTSHLLERVLTRKLDDKF